MMIWVYVMHFALNIFRFDFWNDDVCFFVWIYEMKQFKLHVERCLVLLSDQWMHLICKLQGPIGQALAIVEQCNDHTNKPLIERSHF